MRKTILIFLLLIPFSATLLSCSGKASGANRMVRASGFIEGQKYRIASEIGGQVAQLAVGEGDWVEEGDLLLRIDSPQLDVARDRAEKGLELARIALQMLEDLPYQTDIIQAEAALDRGVAEKKVAEASLEFLRASYSPLEPPDAELKAAEFSVEVAERGVELAQARLDQVNAGVSELQVTMAQASLEEAQANLDLVDRQLEKLRLTSPRTGRVSEVFVREGEVAPVGETLLEVLDVKALRLRVFVPEAQLSRINLGGQVRIMVDSYPDEVFQGSILHIADEAQFTPTTVQTQEERVKLVFAILIAVEDPGGRLKAGMPADAELEIDS